MKARHHQKGYVFLHGKTWYLRYRIPEMQPDGSFKNTQKCQPLVKYGEQYRSKRAVGDLAEEILAPYNNNRASLLSGATLNYWMENHYLPMIKESRKASTYPDYFNKWNRYVRPHGEIPLRDFRTGDGQEMLRAISREHNLSRTTLGHIKSLVSGAFTCAIRQDVLRGNNPMRYVEVPRVRGPEDTYAYSLEEIMAMLQVLDGMAATVVAVASFTGPRDSELRGLRWEDYEGKEIFITRSVWRGIVDETKTKASKAPVPVIELVAGYLDVLRRSQGRPDEGYVFATSKGTPRDLQMFAQRVIRPALTAAGMEWHGYHACRRGLATNLHRLGVPDVVIQRILRHSNAGVTRRCYIKTSDPESVKAMEKLQSATVVQQLKSMGQTCGAKQSISEAVSACD